jgi:phospholipase/carboxylesterase
MTNSIKLPDTPAPAEERYLRGETKLYYDLYVPDGDEGARPLLVALHGYGANKRQMMREARLLAPDDFAVASVQGFHQHLKERREAGEPLRYGFGWLTNFHPEDSVALHHRALVDLIATLAREGLADRQRVFLLGFSQSCALNYRFAFTHNETLRGVIGICGGLPGDWETSTLYRQTAASVLHLYGTRDELYPAERVRDYESRLGARAEDVEVKAYDAAHEMTAAMREDARAWLRARATL